MSHPPLKQPNPAPHKQSPKIVTLCRAVQHSTACPAGCILLRDKYVQILVLTAQPPAVEGKVWLCCSSRTQKLSVSLVCQCRPGYAEGPELCEAGWARVALLGGPGVAAVGGAGGEPV